MLFLCEIVRKIGFSSIFLPSSYILLPNTGAKILQLFQLSKQILIFLANLLAINKIVTFKFGKSPQKV